MKKIFFALLLASTTSFAHLKIEDFGGACNGAFDNTSALNAANAAASNGPVKTISFPAGVCNFYSQPKVIKNGVSLRGEGINNTILRRMYSASNFIHIQGIGSRVSDLLIEAHSGTSGGVGLLINCVATEACGLHVIENTKVSGNAINGAWGTWLYPISIDGSARALPPSGMRTVAMRFVQAFNGTWVGAQIWDCAACEWYGGGVYQGGGSTQRVFVGGAKSSNIRIDAHIDLPASTVWPGVMR
jgi:hypothetical protein